MDPASLAASAVAILTPYVVKGAKELTEAAGEMAYEKAKQLLGTLKARWSQDPVASDSLSRFEKKPDVHGPALQEIIQEKIEKDPQLAAEVDRTVKEIGPKLQILVKMAKGTDVTGLKAKTMRSGSADVTLDIQEGERIVGGEFENLG